MFYVIYSYSLNKREKEREKLTTHHVIMGKKKKNGENKMSLQEFFKQTPMPVRASGILHGRDGGGQEFDTQSFDGGFTANAATTSSGKKKTNTVSPFRGNDSASLVRLFRISSTARLTYESGLKSSV